MIQVSRLKKSYGTQLLFDDVTFTLDKGEKVGLVGRNGFGKSTLFKLITKEEEADSGEIIIPSNYIIGTLKQYIQFSKKNLLDECSQALKAEEKDQIYHVEKILMGLGFSEMDFASAPESFSGGFQMRITLAKLLIQSPDLLLLDEPTNYLDIVSIRWLKSFLNSFSGEFIIITHDRGFMDEVTNATMGIHRKKIKKIKGDTFKYYQQLIAEEELYEKSRVKQGHAIRHMQTYIDRFRASARRATQAQSKLKKLSKLKEMAALKNEDTLAFKFNYKHCPAKILAQYENYSFAYHKMNEPLIKGFNLFIRQGDRIAIVGKNGAGKSTLLNLMAGELKPLTGKSSCHPQTEKGFFGQMNIERLHHENTIETEIAMESSTLTRRQVKSICGLMLFDQALAEKKIGVLSGGERSRVLLGKILAREVNLLLLDEPTNHLDQESIEGLLDGFDNFDGAVILVTHSEMILRRFATRLIIFKNGETINFEGDYDDFLRRVGWEDAPPEGQNTSDEKTSKKEKRQKRAEITAERSRVLGPLKKKMEQTENQIREKEKKIEDIKHRLIAASEQQDINETIALSKSLAVIKREIDELYSVLDLATTKYETELEVFVDKYGNE
ncbi:MAG: ATP-binding cassette domain-containing protein [Deltaproteobacteria bacterium]|nr:ATP-binding cassette domain-containing protein [Deltaproteobacteria bacterium]